jgi:hypothetical protein
MRKLHWRLRNGMENRPTIWRWKNLSWRKAISANKSSNNCESREELFWFPLYGSGRKCLCLGHPVFGPYYGMSAEQWIVGSLVLGSLVWKVVTARIKTVVLLPNPNLAHTFDVIVCYLTDKVLTLLKVFWVSDGGGWLREITKFQRSIPFKYESEGRALEKRPSLSIFDPEFLRSRW